MEKTPALRATRARNDPTKTSPTPTPKPAVTPRSATIDGLNTSQILALQRQVGNSAVIKLLSAEQTRDAPRLPAANVTYKSGQAIQRHPNHSPEEDLEVDEIPELRIQRSHRSELATQSSPLRVQRVTVFGVKMTSSTAVEALVTDYQFTDPPRLANALEKNKYKNNEFTTYKMLARALYNDGHKIGGRTVRDCTFEEALKGAEDSKYEPKGFEGSLRVEVDRILKLVPRSHVKTAKAIIRKKAMESSSFDYTSEVLTIAFKTYSELLEPVYTRVTKAGTLSLIDRIALSEFLAMDERDAVIEEDKKLGRRRKVIAFTRDDPFAKTKLLEWQVLHELGHSVDHRVKWTTNYARDPDFGGWRKYGNARDPRGLKKIFSAFLMGVSPGLVRSIINECEKPTISSYHPWNVILDALEGDRTFEEATKSCGEHFGRTIQSSSIGHFERVIEETFRRIVAARRKPWMFDSFPAELAVGSKVFFLDEYENWVSISQSALPYRLSPYQFASPEEWFAEAYAAFYGSNDSARNHLNDRTKKMFTALLGAEAGLTGTGPREGELEHWTATGRELRKGDGDAANQISGEVKGWGEREIANQLVDPSNEELMLSKRSLARLAVDAGSHGPSGARVLCDDNEKGKEKVDDDPRLG